MGPSDSAKIELEDSVGKEEIADGRNGGGGGGETKLAELDSLGEALAGVSLGSSNNASSFNPVAFSLGGGNNGSQDAGGWGNYHAETAHVHSSVFPGPTSVSAAAPVPLDLHEAGSEGHGGNNHQSIDLLLSHTASQALRDNVFNLTHGNLPPLNLKESNRAPTNDDASGSFRIGGQSFAPGPSPMPTGTAPPEMRPQGGENPRTSDSPSSMPPTNVSSRSVSPHASNGDHSANANRTIHAYQRYDSAPLSDTTSWKEDDRSTSGYSNSRAHGSSSPSINSVDRTPRSRSHHLKPTGSSNGLYDQAPYDRSAPYLQPDASLALQQTQVATPQPQVLYMAVPAPDGRGQVLQPVQMVQIPGRPYTYVVPGAGNLPGMPPPALDGSSPMMGLPPVASPQPVGADYSPSFNEAISPSEHRVRDSPYSGDNSRSFESGSLLPRDDYNRAGSPSNAGSPFQADPAVASLYSSQQRPPLDALLGQVRRLSRDQVGCRLVQQALDEEGPMAATLILNEGLPFWGEAMVDPFGNYLFQKILEKVTAQERVMLVTSVSTRLVNASLNLHGTRSVQKIVELCAQDEQSCATEGEETSASILTKALSPAAARLCIDSHGNHVIQRILLKLSPKHSKFVFDAVAASVGDVARHRHGCCVIQRCLDSPPTDARAHLVRRIVDKALELMQDAYGNYVVQYVLDVCSNDDVHAVCESVVGKVNLLAIQKFSSNVMEKCLERCSDRVKELYLHEMSDPDRIRELMMDPFGNYVVQRALSVATHVQAIRLVEAMRPHLIATQTTGPHGQRNGGVRNTAGGRRIIAKICRRFPNFTLNAVGTQEELYSQSKGHHRHHHHNHHNHNHNHQHHHHNHHNHHQHHPASVVASYAPVGPPAHVQHFAPDPRLTGGHLIQAQPSPQASAVQQQSFYSAAGATNTYYDPFSNGLNGYPGM